MIIYALAGLGAIMVLLFVIAFFMTVYDTVNLGINSQHVINKLKEENRELKLKLAITQIKDY